jgi:hypothetical protein
MKIHSAVLELFHALGQTVGWNDFNRRYAVMRMHLKTGILHEDLHAFLLSEVTGWGISRLPWLLWLPWLKVRDQILANAHL